MSSLASSERLHAAAERISPQRRAYSEILLSIRKEFEKNLQEKDYIQLFELEKIAQEHDSAFHVADKEKTLQVFGAMDMLQKQFLECSDPERVKERFMPSIVRLKMQGTRMKDRAFDATENSVCGFSTVSKVPAVFPLKTRITPYERSASKPFRKSISGI